METSLEQAKKDIHKALANNLQELLEKNYDAEHGFTKTMIVLKDSQLKTFSQRKAAQIGPFTNELDKEIRSLNETLIDSGSSSQNFKEHSRYLRLII
jgi:hypothetical protein